MAALPITQNEANKAAAAKTEINTILGEGANVGLSAAVPPLESGTDGLPEVNTDTLVQAIMLGTVRQMKPTLLKPIDGGNVLSATFESGDGNVILFVSGSCYLDPGFAAAARIGFEIQVGGNPVGELSIFATSASFHMACVANFVLCGELGAAEHQLELVPFDGTLTDVNDTFNVLVWEVP